MPVILHRLSALLIANVLAGCTNYPMNGVYRANFVTHGRIVQMTPLPTAPDVYGRTRWTMQYNVLLTNGETLQIVTAPDRTAMVTDCVEVAYIGQQVTSLAVIDPNVGCPNLEIPNHRSQPLFR